MDTLFSGKFYIDQTYGSGLVPSLIKMFRDGVTVEKKEIDLINNCQKAFSKSGKLIDSGASPQESGKRVVVLNFKQPVVKYSTYYWLGTQAYIRILADLKQDTSVLGVVIDTDSGGGQVYGTPETYDAILDFKQTKPIGFFTNGYLCSGAYYIAAPGSFIMANRRADAIGSIGGYTVMIDYDGMIEHFGGKVHTIYSDLSPDKNKGHRAVMDGTDPDYKNYIKTELNPMIRTFHTDMKNARPQLDEEVFMGGTWTGVEAESKGLIDYNGSLMDAVAMVFELSKKSNSNNNNSKNEKTMSKTTKSFPAIQKVLGISGEGIATISTLSGKKGVQLSEAQLDSLEKELAEKDKAVTTANGKVTEAEGKVTVLETAVTTALATAKIGASATTAESITLLGAKVVELGNKPSSKGSKPDAKGDNFEDEDAIVNAEDGHNQMYNNL